MKNSIRQYPKCRIKTIDYYGSKRTWYREFNKLLMYANELGCDKFIDCLAGSGILSLLAAKSGLFNSVHLNEISYLVINYHMVMKDDSCFKKFIEILGEYEIFVQENFDFAKMCLDEYAHKRVQVRTKSHKRAALYYLIQYYSYNAQGGFVDKRKKASDYNVALYETHKLYKNIQITQYHYKKVLRSGIDDARNLIIIDVPYVRSERVQKKSYFVEFTDRQHRYMLELLTKQYIAAKIVVCGYNNQLYNNYFLRCNKKCGEIWHCIKLLRPGDRRVGAEAKERWWVNFDVNSLIEKSQNLFEALY